MSKQIQIAVFVAAALVLSGGGFVAGMTVGPELGKTGAAAAGTGTAGGARQQQAAQRPGVAGGAAIGALAGQGQQLTGRVLSVNDGSITVEVRQPGSDAARSVIVLVGASARLVKTVETDIKLSDMKAGDQVLIVGQTDQTTGTVSATAVVDGVNTLQQVFGGGAGGAAGSGGPRPIGTFAPRQSP